MCSIPSLNSQTGLALETSPKGRQGYIHVLSVTLCRLAILKHVGRSHMSMFASNALLGLGLGFGLENKERSKDQRHY